MTTNNDIYTNKATRKEFRFTKPERSHLGYLEPIDFNLGAKAVSEEIEIPVEWIESGKQGETLYNRKALLHARNQAITEFLRRCEEEFADWEDMEPTFKVLEQIAKEMKGEV